MVKLGMCGSSEADIQTAGFDLLTIRSETEPYLIETASSASGIDLVKNDQIFPSIPPETQLFQSVLGPFRLKCKNGMKKFLDKLNYT